MKKNNKFDIPQEKVRKSNQKALKIGCVACLAFACVFTFQNISPLDYYVNPGIDENTKFVVAHACGGINVDGKNKKYLNVVEGVENNYKNGTRMFEVDFVFSKEGELVGTHKYEYLRGYSSKNRIGFDDYKSTLILDKFHGMTSERLFELIKTYPDAKFIIDTKEKDPFLIYEKLIKDANSLGVDLRQNIIPFVSSYEMLEKLEKIYDFDELMFTNYKAKLGTSELLDIVGSNPKIKYIHIFPVDFSRIDVNEFNKMGKRVFAHMDHGPFSFALNYGCTGIFSDDITENSFNLKYRYILEQKLVDQHQTSDMKLDELLEVPFQQE